MLPQFCKIKITYDISMRIFLTFLILTITYFNVNAQLYQLGEKLVGKGAEGARFRQGYSVSISGDGKTMAEGGIEYNNGDNNIGAVWVFTLSGSNWIQVGPKLVGTGSSNAVQGNSVSLNYDGTLLAIGGYNDSDGVGGAWVFTFTGGNWQQIGEKIAGKDGVGRSYQGVSVSLSSNGKTLAVGAPYDTLGGSVFLYSISSNNWQQIGSKVIGTNKSIYSEFGTSVSLSANGNILAVGGPEDNAKGAVWIFTISGNNWYQLGNKYVADDLGSINQGGSVSLSADGKILAVGAPSDVNQIGGVWIYTSSGINYSQAGKKLVGTGAISVWNDAYQGQSVSLSADGKTLAVGGKGDNEYTGAIWVFTNSGSNWKQVGKKLVGTVTGFNSFQGQSVSISSDGKTIANGGDGYNSNVGAIWIFNFNGIGWLQNGNILLGNHVISQSMQGESVSLSGNGMMLAVGGSRDNGDIGAVWVYSLNGIKWKQMGNKLVGNGVAGITSNQGHSVSLSSNGTLLAVGGYSDSSGVGAVWVYTFAGGNWNQMGKKLVGNGGVGNSQYGYSVCLAGDGKTLAVGGKYDNNGIGAVWVYTLTGSNWSQLGNKIVGVTGFGAANQGSSVSLSSDGKTLAVGGPEDSYGYGAVWVYTLTGSNWTLMGNRLLTVTNSGTTNVQFRYGNSVSLSGDGKTLAIGYEYNNVLNGGIRIFTLTGGNWSQVNKIQHLGNASVSLSKNGKFLAIGDYYNGKAMLTTITGVNASPFFKLRGTGSSDYDDAQGCSISMSSDGKTLAVGGKRVINSQGAVWVYSTLDTIVVDQQPISQTVCGYNFSPLSIAGYGTGPITYKWNTGDTTKILKTKIPGVYFATITGLNRKLISQPATLFEYCEPTILILQPVSQTICGNNFVTFTVSVSGSGPFAYLWSNGIRTDTMRTNLPGGYLVTIFGHTFSGGDTTIVSDSVFLTSLICPITKFDDLDKYSQEINVFPNPTEDELTVTFSKMGNVNEIELFNELGLYVLYLKVVGPIQKLDLKNLKSGFYVLSIKTDQQSRRTKILKE